MTATPTQPSNIYLWNTACACAYIGTTLVRGTPPTPPTQERPDIDTYTQSGYMDISDSFSQQDMHALCCSNDWHYIYVWDNVNKLANYYLSNSSYSSFTWSYYSLTPLFSWNGTRWLYYKSGTEIYSVTDGSSTHGIYETVMRTANNLNPSYESTITENVSSSISQGIEWSPDGYNLYLCEWTGNIYQYVLSTPRNVSTVTTTKTLTGFWNPYTIRFSPTWLKLFIWDRWWGEILQYDLSTPYDISTAVDSHKNLYGYDIFDITDDGRMFCGIAYDAPMVYQYDSN